jgi:hypothetical protein
MAQSYLRTPTVERLGQLLEMLRSGELRIPPFQRDFVWSTEQRIHLLDSVYQGIPSGSFFIWRTSKVLPCTHQIGPFLLALPPLTGSGPHQYLVDGLQRMTTLFATLGEALFSRGDQPSPREGAGLAPDDEPWELLFDLAGEGFVSSAADAAPDTPLLPLRVLLDDRAYDEWRDQHPNLDQKMRNRARAVQSAVRDYLIPIVPLVSDDMEVVQRTFKRINEGGTPMSDVHLARALTWTAEFDLLDHIRTLKVRWEHKGWSDVDDSLVIKLIAGLAGQAPNAPDLEAVARSIQTSTSGGTSILSRAHDGVERAISFFASLDILGPRVLPYVYGFTAIAEVLADLTDLEAEGVIPTLRKWYLMQAYTGRLGVSTPHVVVALRGEARKIAAGEEWPSGKSRRGAKRPPVPVASSFNLSWARSRLAATALAAEFDKADPSPGPHGARRLLADRGSAVTPQLFRLDDGELLPQVRKALQVRDVADAMRRIENRVILDPIELGDLRRALLGPNPSPHLLARHVISEAAAQCLRRADLLGFFKARAKSIREVEMERLANAGLSRELLFLAAPGA